MKSTQVFSLSVLVASAVGVAAVLLDRSTSEAHHVASADLPERVRGLDGENLEPRDQLGGPESWTAGDRHAVVADGPESSGRAESHPVEPPKAATLSELRDFRDFRDRALSEIRQEEAAGKISALNAQAASLDETMPATEAWLKLTPHQSDKLRSVLLTQLDREAEYLRLWAKFADEEILGELRKSDRKARYSELTAFLTPAQLQTYAAHEGSGGK